jgi:hypothetical protein
MVDVVICDRKINALKNERPFLTRDAQLAQKLRDPD